MYNGRAVVQVEKHSGWVRPWAKTLTLKLITARNTAYLNCKPGKHTWSAVGSA